MNIQKAASAGTLESSDVFVTIEPGEGKLEIQLQSKVIHQFGKQIREVIEETLSRLEVTDAKVSIQDMGALDCTLKARVEAAVFRAANEEEAVPWGELE